MTAPFGPAPLQPRLAYAFATIVTAAALGMRLVLDTSLHGSPTLVIFTLPIMLSAYAGGLYPGLLSTALSCFAAAYYLLPPIHSFAIDSGADRLLQFVVLIAGIVISVLSQAFHRARRLADIATDEAQRAKAALQESERRYRAVVEWAPDPMLVHRDGMILYANPAAVRMFGADAADDLLGGSFFDLIHPEVRQEARERLMNPTDPASSWPLTAETFVRRDGAGIDVQIQQTSIVYDGLPAILGSMRDVTERNRVEAALSLSEGRYHTLFEYVPDGILIADTESRYIDANASMCQMLGYARHELVGLHASDIVAPAEIRHIGPALREIEATSDYQREWQLRRKDGSLFGADIIVTKIPDGTLLAMVRDITARRQAEEALYDVHCTLEQRVVERTAQLETANKELEALSDAVAKDLRVAEAADRIKSAFLATMSHELRTPLNSIIGFTGIVLQRLAGPLTAEQARQLGMVQGSARHLLDLINDVLDVSKIEAGQLEVHAEPFDLVQSLDRVTASLKPLADKKSLALTVVVAPGVGTIVSDRLRVEQILINLLSNAVKFTEWGEVTLTADIVAGNGAAGPMVRLRVTDTGIGIKPEDVATLFQPFRQIDGGLARQNEGTGLGLAIAQRLAGLLHGHIAIVSEWAAGSEFTVTLPVHAGSGE